MSSPESSSWTPPRIAAWALAAVAMSFVFGPQFVRAFRPPDLVLRDFVQEWLSAKNYLDGTPVYADQTEALRRHTGIVPAAGEQMLPWNAHPPASVALTIPLGKLTYRDAQLVWNLLTLLLFFASVGIIARELRFPLAPWSVFPAVVLVLLFNPLYLHLHQGQLNLPILFLLTLAWAADRRDRPGWAGIALGVAAGLKLYPVFIFAYFLFARRWRALGTGAAAFLAVNGVALALIGPEELRTYAEQVVPSLLNYQSSWRNVSLSGFWLRVFDPHPHAKIVPLVVNPMAATVLVFVSRVLVAGAVAWVAWRARSVAARDRAFAAAVVGMLLVSPITWTHYFVLLPLPVALLWMRWPPGLPRLVMWPALIALWLPETFFALLALGPAEAQAMVNVRNAPLNPIVNLTALSAFTYALALLFILVLLSPAPEEPGADANERRTEPGEPTRPRDNESEDELLNRRLYGPPAGG